MSETIFARVKFKKKTTAGWAAVNEVLADGEPGLELTTAGVLKMKIGDGTKTWSQLAYLIG